MLFKYSFFVQYCDQKWLSTGCDVIAKLASSPEKALTMAKSKAIKGDRLVWLNDSELEDAKREALL